jgi:hypothetical protein
VPKLLFLLSFIIISLQIPPPNIQAYNKWYQSHVSTTMAKGTQISKLVEAMVTLREDNAFDNSVSALINLKQTSTVDKYRSQFEVLFEVLSIGILKYSTNEFWVNTFISELNVEIRLLLTKLKPTSLQAAFGFFTLLHEEEVLRINQNPKKCDKIQETIEVLEERKEQVQPQKETA